eukprot:CAMPEP_0206589946 /NCGR_PEP_ID=MMETSP0325_2-20121206/39264_1 /ASSEMBLY_ACC=CAM_ASM_000347 /TAXON_ID=2866 /ORGANISM="Crypthecodinium cohnii, Strain Seligo" /LENGTH=36 /DNA_ID= /DNA_START= /DNA_END= /DNA_ORIENTATION=
MRELWQKGVGNYKVESAPVPVPSKPFGQEVTSKGQV